MIHKNFTYSELLTLGWNKTKEHFWFLFTIALIYLVAMGAVGNVPVISSIVSMILTIAVTAVSLTIVHGHTPKYDDMIKPFRTYKVLWHYFLSSIMYFFAIVIGLILLIIPGIYFGVRLQFFIYSIIENEDLGPVDALEKSMKLTKGRFWYLFGFIMMVILVNLIGVLALGVGLFFTLPITGIAYAELYKKLLEQHHTQHNHTA